MLDRIPTAVWPLLIMGLWGAVILSFNLVRLDAFGIDEGAAMALLLNWSVSDQIVNPVTTYGGPDFRALLFIPLGLYWPGSIIAAKVFTLMVCFAAALFLRHWSKTTDSAEVALLATGLFLISPVLIHLADSIALGPYLLAMFGVGMHLDKKYRASQHTISSLYFIQLLVVAITVSLHPIGLAYPLALAWQWYRNPKSDKQKKQVWIGIGISVFVVLAMQTGWIDIHWGANPLKSLHNALLGYNLREPDLPAWAGGAVLILALIYLVIRDFKTLSQDMMGSMLLISIIPGIFVADENWALIALTFVIYRGIPALITVNKALNTINFIGQRGIVFVVLIVMSTLFMQANKYYASQINAGILTPKDLLIQRLAIEASNLDQAFLAASQWPAQTMIICKRDIFKLPPEAENAANLLTMVKGLTHIMFDHRDPHNAGLARNIAEMSKYTETLDIQSNGVIVKFRTGNENTDKQPSSQLSRGTE
ncbi:MAG: hypothetical protein GXP08_14930 [Gammaproteobacteria bacterium]|nr:hypothetical protein [Gammaproteobacteria bacterium]